MEDVRLDVVGPLDQIAQDPAVLRDLIRNPKSGVKVQRRDRGVSRRSHSADALCNVLGIIRVTPPKKYLEASEQGATALSFLNHPSLDSGLDFEMALYTSYRVNNDLRHRLALSFHFIGPGAGNHEVQQEPRCSYSPHSIT